MWVLVAIAVGHLVLVVVASLIAVGHSWRVLVALLLALDDGLLWMVAVALASLAGGLGLLSSCVVGSGVLVPRAVG